MKKNFDNKKYLLKEREKIFESINNIKERIYIEVGGKIIDDQHAARVFVGYNPDNKYEIIKSLNVDFEMIICINAISIIKNKKRKDNSKSYMDEVLRLMNVFDKDNIKFNISITRYRKNAKVDNYIKKLKHLGYNVYKQFEDLNYPYNIKEVFSKDGIFKNEYIPCKEKLVFVVGPGANSGKFATCISQIAYENKNKKISSYRKIETFLVPTLSINNPINLSASMAMCDVRGSDCIDYEYLQKYAEVRCVDERDKETFLLLKSLVPDYDQDKKSIIEFFINEIESGIQNISIAEKHAKKEIVRRYKEYVKKFNNNKVGQIEFDEATRIYELIKKDLTLTDNEINAFLKFYVDFWGFDCQSNVLIEEMGELIQAVCKYKRENYDNKFLPNVIEEIADVHNMIIQMEEYFGVEKIKKIREEKIYRTNKYIKKEFDEMKGNK